MKVPQVVLIVQQERIQLVVLQVVQNVMPEHIRNLLVKHHVQNVMQEHTIQIQGQIHQLHV